MELRFDEIYDQYNNLVFNLSLQYVQNTNDAQEITQDVFVSVYHSLDNFKNNSKVSTWIYRITINKSLDFLKAKKRKKRFAFIISIFGDTNDIVHDSKNFEHPGVLLEQKEALEKIFCSINKLPNNQKTALILNKIEYKSLAEIGEIMELSTKAVESLVQRAKKRLSGILNEIEEID
jgi:RNA polymerase sigma factor (sigma-70 family)